MSSIYWRFHHNTNSHIYHFTNKYDDYVMVPELLDHIYSTYFCGAGKKRRKDGEICFRVAKEGSSEIENRIFRNQLVTVSYFPKDYLQLQANPLQGQTPVLIPYDRRPKGPNLL